MTRISIVIPTLNEAECLPSCLEAAQACSPHEIIVADGGSSDATLSIAQKAGCQTVVAPRGRGSQQNAGAANASGDALLFLHADCHLHEQCLIQLAESLVDAKVTAGAFVHRIEAAGWAFRLIERSDSLRARLWKMPYGDQGIFVRHTTFEQIGGFPDVPLMEDVRLMRILRRQGKFRLLPGPIRTSPRRWQHTGVLRQTAKNWALRMAERLGAEPESLVKYYGPAK